MSVFEPFLRDCFQVSVEEFPEHWTCVRQFKEPDEAFDFSMNCGFSNRLEWVTRRITEVSVYTHFGEYTGTTYRGETIGWGVLLKRD